MAANEDGGGAGNFPPTRWSVVEKARGSDAQERSQALELLFSAYWKPVYKFVRLKFSRSPEEARDLTQGFFLELLERDLLAKFDPARSRLRTYIRLCADSFVRNEIKHAGRLKRGGDAVHLPLDVAGAEDELARTVDPAAIPAPGNFEEFFEKEWIRALFSSAVDDLRSLSEMRGKATAFRLFEAYDLAENEEVSYNGLAALHGISVSDVTNQIAWARREFRRLARERLRRLCASDEEYRREAEALFGG
jgi:RNA polymerase sigma factor (sigma-70 family)